MNLGEKQIECLGIQVLNVVRIRLSCIKCMLSRLEFWIQVFFLTDN